MFPHQKKGKVLVLDSLVKCENIKLTGSDVRKNRKDFKLEHRRKDNWFPPSKLSNYIYITVKE